jgi:dihydrolipoamide dehydrogenase
MDNGNVVIIGGGPAGYAAAVRVAQLGGKATLIEKDALGGTCLNSGCVPARTFARAAELAGLAGDAKDYGITFAGREIDFAKVTARKDVVVKTLVGGIKFLMGANKVEIVEGQARFVDRSTIEVTSRDGSSRRIQAGRAIIATGSRCRELQAPVEARRVLSTSDVFKLTELPRSMLVVGTGFVGVSLASIFSRLGTKVTLIGQARMLEGIDAEIVSAFEKELKKDKIAYYPQCRITAIGDGETVLLEGGREVSAQFILAAEEREANTDGIEAIGAAIDSRGGLVVNERMESTVPGIYAAGDVTMRYMWTPAAYMEGIVAAENIMGKSSTIDYTSVPYWTNTIPGIAGVGLTEEKALADGYPVRVVRFPFAGNGTATILGQRTGLVKVIAEEKYDQVLGIHMMGPGAADLIAEACLALRLEMTSRDIGSAAHVHPSLSEALWEAARAINGEAVHFISP